VIITTKHLRQAKMCSRGARQFFIRHGLNYTDFVKNGIEEKHLLNTEDQMAKDLVDIANGRKQQESNGRL